MGRALDVNTVETILVYNGKQYYGNLIKAGTSPSRQGGEDVPVDYLKSGQFSSVGTPNATDITAFALRIGAVSGATRDA